MMNYKLLLIAACILVSAGSGCEKKRVLPDVDPVPIPRYTKDNTMSSQVLGVSVKYSIYLPESYNTDKDKRYPVVYMLHGIGDDNNSWNGNYLHANLKIDSWTAQGLGEMIYVYPQGFSSYYCNRYDGTFSYMDMFANELVPFIDKTYRTIPDKQHRAISGYSMGGFGAIALAEKHPELFIACAPLSMSVRTDWQYKEESQNGWNNQWGKIFGGYGEAGDARITEYYKQHCPIHYFNAANKEALSAVNWYLICGDNEENLLYANDELHCVMRDNGYKHEYRVVDGGHSSSVWMPALNEVLTMFDYYMNGGNLWSPEVNADVEQGQLEAEEDGSVMSSAYKEKHTGALVYIVHDGLSQDILKELMSFVMNSAPSAAFALVPCDVSNKTLQSWISQWKGVYPHQKEFVLGIEAGAASALALPSDTFEAGYYLNPALGSDMNVANGQKIYFAGTDLDANYRDMDRLYVACKQGGASFEYRIVRGSSSHLYNLVKSLESIKSYISF
ncbi:MAG: esterase family protein [Bacteroidales bacterium]|nr:esterase family protein [Bacteroidales bacterium]